MFTIFSCFNSELINGKALEILQYMIEKYKCTENGKWMNNIDTSKLKFYWCNDMTDENEVLGSWSMFFYNKIFIKALDKSVLTGNEQIDKLTYEGHFNLIIPTVFHEIYHRYQCQKLTPFLYIVAAFPYIREFTIEPPAYKISDNAYDWLQQLEQKRFEKTKVELHTYFYGSNFNNDTLTFIENYDKEYCESQYNLYKQMRKENKVPIIPALTIPPHMI